MRTAPPICLSLALLLAPPATAQQVAPPQPSPYTRAIAAGYKALTTCNGIYTAGRTLAQIDRDELAGIYPEYGAIVSTLTATIEGAQEAVSVAYDPKMPPRLAQWGKGCRIAPIGTELSQLASIGYRYPRPIPGNADPRPWPMGDGSTAPKLPSALVDVTDRAFAPAYGDSVKTIGIVILYEGKIVAERYAPSWTPYTAHRTWSVAKSIAGTLVGMARMNPAEPAAVPEWHNPTPDDPRATITLDHLLRMGSGLHSPTAGNRTDAVYFGGTAVTEETVAWPLETKPGTRFRYANNDILLAVRAMRTTLGEDRYRDYPATALFTPLGMRHTEAGTDWRGNYILSSQVWSTARDLARLGQFWLQDGLWQGKRLLPEGWMRYMTTPLGPQPATGPGYGATMWLFGPAQGLPAGSYAAQGNRGQYVMVVPAKKLVIVRRGEDPGTARFDIARFAADVIAATP